MVGEKRKKKNPRKVRKHPTHTHARTPTQKHTNTPHTREKGKNEKGGDGQGRGGRVDCRLYLYFDFLFSIIYFPSSTFPPYRIVPLYPHNFVALFFCIPVPGSPPVVASVAFAFASFTLMSLVVTGWVDGVVFVCSWESQRLFRSPFRTEF